MLSSNQPVVFHLKNKKDRKELSNLKRSGKVWQIVDDFENQKRELEIVRNPKLFFSQEPGIKSKNSSDPGVWIYYPWSKSLVHVLEEKAYRELRSSRNKNLISGPEQARLERFRVGLAGLNVGNHAAICLALETGAARMKLADNDTLALSNLNRFRARLEDLGLNKAVLTARQVYEINPFAKIEVWPEGLTQETMKRFLASPRIDLLIEEMDNLKLKVLIRQEARKQRIPVLMVTGSDENIVVDVERYDLKPNLPLLNGRLDPKLAQRIEKTDFRQIALAEKAFLARNFVGKIKLSERLEQSFSLVGRSLAGIPQLAESSFLRGATIGHFVRQIASGEKIISGRYFVKLNSNN